MEHRKSARRFAHGCPAGPFWSITANGVAPAPRISSDSRWTVSPTGRGLRVLTIPSTGRAPAGIWFMTSPQRDPGYLGRDPSASGSSAVTMHQHSQDSPGAPVTDEDVPAFWQALGLPGLADIHVH